MYIYVVFPNFNERIYANSKKMGKINVSPPNFKYSILF